MGATSLGQALTVGGTGVGATALKATTRRAAPRAGKVVTKCFVRGTPIATAAGLVPIESVRPGDGILSRDEHTGAQTLKAAVRTFVHYTDDLVRLRVDVEDIVTTAEHPFWVDGRGWVEAAHLHAGDVLSLADGGQTRVASVTSERAPAPVPVYNVEVADFHTYFVASAGVWVHNCGSGVNVVFKSAHGARHLPNGISASEAESAIRGSIGRGVSGASSTGSFWGRVTVKGSSIEYRAYTLKNGTINVGTYYPPK